LMVGAADKSVSGPPTTLACALAAVGETSSPAITDMVRIIFLNWISYLNVIGK